MSREPKEILKIILEMDGGCTGLLCHSCPLFQRGSCVSITEDLHGSPSASEYWRIRRERSKKVADRMLAEMYLDEVISG